MKEPQPDREPLPPSKSTKAAKTSPARTRRRKAEPEVAIAGQVLALNPGQVELVRALVSEFAGDLQVPASGDGATLHVEAALPGLGEFWLHQLQDLAVRQQALRALFEAS